MGRITAIGILLLLFIISFQHQVCAQSYEFLFRIDTPIKKAKIDNLGNVFVVTPKNELLKFNAGGKLLWNYNNKNFGDISQLDVTDPLRVVIYYGLYQQVIVLNNNLNEISHYTFINNPELQVVLVATANNNGYWVYDQNNRELKKLTNSFADEIATGNIYQRNGLNISPKALIATDQNVFINDGDKGVHIFDVFGNYYKTALIAVPAEFEVSGSEIYYSKDGKLQTYNFMTFNKRELALPEAAEAGHEYILHLNRLAIINEKGLTLWACEGDR